MSAVVAVASLAPVLDYLQSLVSTDDQVRALLTGAAGGFGMFVGGLLAKWPALLTWRYVLRPPLAWVGRSVRRLVHRELEPPSFLLTEILRVLQGDQLEAKEFCDQGVTYRRITAGTPLTVYLERSRGAGGVEMEGMPRDDALSPREYKAVQKAAARAYARTALRQQEAERARLALRLQQQRQETDRILRGEARIDATGRLASMIEVDFGDGPKGHAGQPGPIGQPGPAAPAKPTCDCAAKSTSGIGYHCSVCRPELFPNPANDNAHGKPAKPLRGGVTNAPACAECARSPGGACLKCLAAALAPAKK